MTHNVDATRRRVRLYAGLLGRRDVYDAAELADLGVEAYHQALASARVRV